MNNANNKRIAKNTLLLYVRMLLTLLIGLYTSRVILQTLGISDFGLYNVVGGVVTMFSFLNGTLSTSTQRYLNFEIGKKDEVRIKQVFSSALLMHVILVIIVLLLAETIGVWFVANKLNIEAGRETAAMWCFQFSILVVAFQIVQLPFMSTIIAHENMSIYAYISIYETIMKLVIVYLIQAVSVDKLILYAFLYFVVQLSVVIIYNLYCRSHYKEASFKVLYDKELFREMSSFAGWNLIGSVANVCNTQGVNILFNLFFNTVVNAARGVAFQVNGIIVQFANNFQLAVKPQVVKYYASGDIVSMKNLTINSAKYSAFLLILLMAPVFADIEFVLKVWLVEYPVYTPEFVRIIFIQTIFASISTVALMIVQATGYLKKVGIYAGGFNLLIMPLTYVSLKIGCNPILALSIGLLIPFTETFISLYWMKRYIDYPIGEFYKHVYGPVCSYGFCLMIAPYILHTVIANSLSETSTFLIVSIFSGLLSVSTIYLFILDKENRTKVSNLIITKIRK